VQDLVQTHLPQLHRETSALVQALRQPQARGRWGEEQLKRVVELAGMLEHCDFEQQVSVNVDERRQRPDLVVRLPGGRNIVIDAKVAIDAYLSAVEAPDEASRERLLDQHAAQVRAHVQRLAAKSYFEQFDPTPEFVVLFVPGEAFFSAALMRDPTLIGFAAENRVIPASPTTLIALLKAVAYGWRQEALAQNARDIAALGKDLYERIGRLAEHWSDVGERIRQATEAYNRSVGTLEARDLPAARRFRDLRAVGDANKIKDLIPLTTETRALSAEELTRRPGGLIWGGRRRSAVAEVVASAAGYILIRWRKQFSRGQGCRFARHLKSGAADAELIRLCLSGTDRQSSVSLATETVR
jgi:DNA recombination protein RmuC